MDNFEIDPDLQDAIPELKSEEYKQLEENILTDGEVRDPLIIWKGKNTIVDGHNRWSIIQRHPEIPYKTQEMSFDNKWDAIEWICYNQAGRRNLDRQAMNIVIGTASMAKERKSGEFHGNQYTQPDEDVVVGELAHNQNSNEKHATRAEVAAHFHVTPDVVRHAEDVTKAVDLADEISPGFKEEYKSGAVKVSDNLVKKVSEVSDENRQELVEDIRSGKITEARNLADEDLQEQEEREAMENDPVYAAYPNDYDDVLGADSSELLEAFRKCMEDAYDILESTPQYDYLLTDEGYEIALSKVNEVAEKLKSLKRETL